jgi:hypothetical protein
MALTHVTAVRNSLAGIVSTATDASTGNASGHVQITKTAGNYTGANLLAEIALANPAFGSASGGTITANGTPVEDSSADNTGTAVEFRVIDRGSNEVFKGTVTATGGGGDMELSSTSITAGDAVRINSFTYTASA